MRNLSLSREEAELLDTLLLKHAKDTNDFSETIGNISAQLCETWGMSYWHHRGKDGITKEHWENLVKFSEFGHREKSVTR